jgi:hypothetical protein
MTIWELMTEDVKEKVEAEFNTTFIDHFFKAEDEDIQKIEDVDKYLDEFNCFYCHSCLYKTENRKITNIYFLYEMRSGVAFGDNNELYLLVGHEKAAIINRNTFEEIAYTYH